jgi:hypothetical protein
MPFAAPICIGSKIYESTAQKAESSFEEERVRRWIQRTVSQQLGHNTGMPDSMKRDTQTRLGEVHQRAGIPMDSTVYKLTGQKEGTSNGYFGFTTAEPMNARNGFPSDSAGVENVSMRPGKLHSNVAASLPSTQGDLFKTGNEKGMERAGQNEVLDDVTIVTKSVTDDIMAMFGDPDTNENPAGADQSKALDDVTIDTKSVTDDIMAMFSESRDPTSHSEARPSAHRNVFVTANEDKIRTQPTGSFVERAGKSEVLDDVTINTKSVTDDIMAMFSGDLTRNNPGPRVQTSSVFYNSPSTSIPSDSESRTLNAVADYKMTTTTIQQEAKQVLGISKGEASKSEVSAQISQVHMQRNGTTSLQSREVVSIRKDGSMFAVKNAPPLQKRTDSAAGVQWVTKETKSSILVESSKAEVGVAQDRNRKSTVKKEERLYDDGAVRSTSSRKRSSWSTSAKDTQCIYISDEEEKLDDREDKKQRVQFRSTTSNDGSGVMESGTPIANRSGLTRVQQHPAQYSPALCSTSSKNNTSPNGALQR